MVVGDGEEYEGMYNCEADVELIDPGTHWFPISDTNRRSSQPKLLAVKTYGICQGTVDSNKEHRLTCSVVVATIVREGERLQ